MNRVKNVYYTCLLYCLSCLLIGCQEETNDEPFVVQQWDIPLTTDASVPSVSNRLEYGQFLATLYSDNTFHYELIVEKLQQGDRLIMSHMHQGESGEIGPIFLPLVDKAILSNEFDAYDTARGVLTLTSDEVDRINRGGLYINIRSEEVETGLLRGAIP
ncbi:CHRD domain-containing protein [Algivirga pacifica]|uniref:CHRD domain-containing protein n=1 Tax=Algivirga pacifica TaxID=1162670 RepID=A0ABP9DBX3_9BACT